MIVIMEGALLYILPVELFIERKMMTQIFLSCDIVKLKGVAIKIATFSVLSTCVLCYLEAKLQQIVYTQVYLKKKSDTL
jgi:hypothetical protein